MLNVTCLVISRRYSGFSQEATTPNFPALRLLHDPQSFCEKLYDVLQNTTLAVTYPQHATLGPRHGIASAQHPRLIYIRAKVPHPPPATWHGKPSLSSLRQHNVGPQYIRTYVGADYEGSCCENDHASDVHAHAAGAESRNQIFTIYAKRYAKKQRAPRSNPNPY
jgi:hypothetical protein